MSCFRKPPSARSANVLRAQQSLKVKSNRIVNFGRLNDLCNISDKPSLLSWNMFLWQQLYLSNHQHFKVWSVISRSCKHKATRIGVKFSANSIAHMLRIIKEDFSNKEHVFHAPDNHSNKEVNVDVICNVMTLLTLRFKVKTVYTFKTSYFNE